MKRSQPPLPVEDGTSSVGKVRQALRAHLAAAGVPSPGADAEWMLRDVTGWSRFELMTRGGEALADEQAAVLREMAERRARREPLQLILGRVGFRHLELEVRPGVFVPRPETEVLAEEAIARVPVGGLVVEPCTGTGAVACALASEAQPSRVLATDVSAEAVSLARDNAERCRVAVAVFQGDLLAPLDRRLRGRVDVLVSNPPYVADRELDELPPEVSGWDPRAALVAGPTGHEVSDRLMAAAGDWLAPGGWVLIEVAETRAAAAVARAAAAGLVDARVVRDLTGRDRIVAARRP